MSQIHQPNVFVDKSATEEAAKIILQFEDTRRLRRQATASAPEIPARCEACGQTTTFAAALDGTTQECPHCRAYVDVGGTSWDESADNLGG